MAPNTRSRTVHPHHTNTLLPTPEEDIGNIDVNGEGETAPQTPPQTLDPNHDAEAEEPEGIETRTTPSRKVTSSTRSFQIGLALCADPNEGRCLVTNVPSPAVRSCHLVAQATNPQTLTKLEYVWGMKIRPFNLDTRYNVLRLRADWHILFDRAQWMLVPEVKIIKELEKIYLIDECPTSNLREQFENENEPFNYYFIPAPSLRDPICRFPNVNSHEHETYLHPFSELGPLKSYILPHYVIFNTGKKLVRDLSRPEVLQMRHVLSQNLSITVEDARSALHSIQDLYTKWMEDKVPAQWRRPDPSSNTSHLPSEEGQDGPSQGETMSQTPPQAPAPDHDAKVEGPKTESIEIRTMPRSRKVTSSTHSFKIGLALSADPNDSRCLVTNAPGPAVQSCYLVAQATNPQTLTKLEYIWGMKSRQFSLDTRYNVLRLRADWHILFDMAQWILVPEVRIIEELKKIYLTDKCPTSNLRERFENEKEPFNYYVVPAPSLRDAICRFPNLDSYEHKIYAPHFSELDSLKSHIHPHYVIFNAGQKLSNATSITQLVHMSDYLSENASITVEAANLALIATVQLYGEWTTAEVPAQWRRSNPSHPPVEAGQDGPSQGGPPPRRQGHRSGTRSQGSQVSAGQYGGDQKRAIYPFQPPEDDDSSSVTGDMIIEGDTAWIEYIHNWQKQGEDAVESWESDALNDSCDKQLAAYVREHARTPPSPGFWNRWEPAWDDRKLRYPSKSGRAQFSSNDWAVFKNGVYLTRPDHTQVTL